MKGNFFAVGVALTIGSIYSLTAFSQARPESLVKQRQSAMTLQGKYFYPQTRPMAQGKIPYDATVMARNAAFLDALSKMPWDGFTPATREVKSGATPAVFTEVGKFQEAQQQYMAEVSKLVSEKWGALTDAQKQPFEDKNALDKKRLEKQNGELNKKGYFMMEDGSKSTDEQNVPKKRKSMKPATHLSKSMSDSNLKT